MGYLAATLILVVIVASSGAVMFVRHENRPAHRPSRIVTQRVTRRAPRVAAGDSCLCGGTLMRTGETTDQFGDLLGCTGCDRSWTLDGRKIIRR